MEPPLGRPIDRDLLRQWLPCRCQLGFREGSHTRNAQLTVQLDQFVNESIKSGRDENASEVICAGLRALARSEAEDRVKVQALKIAIQEGLESGLAKGDVIDRLRGVIRERTRASLRRIA